jgi:hypothetical protein
MLGYLAILALTFLSKNPALLLSILALVFTIFSFWWMNWRRGKIIVGIPRSFAATSGGKQGLVMVQLPLVFYNDGAATRIIQNLRLTLEQNGEKSSILHFNNTLGNLASNDNRQWARQFAVEGRKSHSSIYVFQRTPGNFVFLAGKCKAILEAKLENQKWKKILTFYIQTPETAVQASLNAGQIIAYDNDVDD